MDFIKEKIASFLFGFVLEKIPFLKDVNGAKRTIGQLAIGVGIVVDGVAGVIHGLATNFAAQFPTLGAIDTKTALYAGTITVIVGKVIKFVGDLHADYKGE